MDPRYYDLTSRLDEAGVSWDHLSSFLNAYTLHPFTRNLNAQLRFCTSDVAKDAIIKYGGNVQIYDYLLGSDKAYTPEHSRFYMCLPSHFKVHVGSIEFFCDYLGLPKITAMDAVNENMKVMSPPYCLPVTHRTVEEHTKVLETAKFLWRMADKEKNPREAERLRMIGSILDHDQEIIKTYGSL